MPTHDHVFIHSLSRSLDALPSSFSQSKCRIARVCELSSSQPFKMPQSLSRDSINIAMLKLTFARGNLEKENTWYPYVNNWLDIPRRPTFAEAEMVLCCFSQHPACSSLCAPQIWLIAMGQTHPSLQMDRCQWHYERLPWLSLAYWAVAPCIGPMMWGIL